MEWLGQDIARPKVGRRSRLHRPVAPDPLHRQMTAAKFILAFERPSPEAEASPADCLTISDLFGENEIKENSLRPGLS
jgi:hypothetical protein